MEADMTRCEASWRAAAVLFLLATADKTKEKK
jgi:hypothetical protein